MKLTHVPFTICKVQFIKKRLRVKVQGSRFKGQSSKFKVQSSKLWSKVPKDFKDLKDPKDLTDVNFARSGFAPKRP